MPLNESSGLISSLTEKEQKEAMAAVYGLGDLMSPDTLTYEDRVRMRRLLDQMDQKDTVGSTKEFDLNKPPAPPYVYREFPFLLYNHTSRQAKPAKNQEERERMLAAGWSEDPFPSEVPEVLLTSDELAEAEEVNQKLKKRRA
jgi:hypothetical protein